MNLKGKPQASKRSRIISFLTPSIASFVFVAVFLSQTIQTSGGLLQDCDTGYHLRAGEYMLDTLSIPKYDPFSFHSPAPPWIAHEWLSEVLMYSIYRFWGLTGIVIFFSILISFVYYFLLKILQSLKANIIIAVIVIIFAIASSQMHWLARPHIFSMLLILNWYYLLYTFQYNKRRKILYLQIPLMLLWVNMHAGFIIGFVLNGIYLFGNVVELISSRITERDIPKKKVILLGLITAACFIVSLLNPYGHKILLFPFKLLSEKFIVDNIGEFISPNFHSLWAIPFEIFLLFSLAVFAFSRGRLNLIEILLLLLFMHMSLFSARYIPLLCIIATPIVIKQLNQVMETSTGKFSSFLKTKGNSFSEIDASGNNFIWPTIAVLIVVLLSSYGHLKHTFDAEKKPVAASKFLEQESVQGNMFNMDEFGDYIIYRNYPAYKVFIDGRIDMYGATMLQEYNKVIGFESGWEKILKKYNVTWIIYDSGAPLARYLMQNKSWHLIYSDKAASIFLEKIPENHRLIQKYKSVPLFVDVPE